MRKLLILLLLSGIILFSGCISSKKENGYTSVRDYKIGKELTQISKIIDENVDKIDKSSNNINKKSDSIIQEVEKIEKNNFYEKIQSHLNNIKKLAEEIREETITIKELSKELSISKIALNTAKDKVEDTNEDLKKIAKERDLALERLDKSESETKKTLQWLIFASILGFGGSVALFVMGNKMGLGGAIASISILILAITVSQYIMIIAWGGLAIIAIIVLFIIYEAYVQRLVNKELVETVEMTKENMDKDNRIKVFGEGKNTGLAGKLQSKITSNAVKKQKKKLGSLWKINKKNPSG